MKIFDELFTQNNSYIEPYSSSTDGGELVTEFNQRAQLNVLGTHEVDLTEEGYSKYLARMTGTAQDSHFQLGNDGASLSLSAGEALINGYYVKLTNQLIVCKLTEIAGASDLPANAEADAKVTKKVILQINATQNENNEFDQRLVPPLGTSYKAVNLLVTDADYEPTATEALNQLLLGTVSRTAMGTYEIWNNPYKSRIIDITHINGAENYDRLIEAPSDATIYGVKGTEENHLVDINEWTWLGYSSPLGKMLRNLTESPDDAGGPGGINADGDGKVLPIIVGRVGQGDHDKQLIRMILRDVDATKPPRLQYRVLKDGTKGPDCFEMQEVEIPFATKTSPGLISGDTFKSIQDLIDDCDSLNAGTQYGPYETLSDAITKLEQLKAYKRQTSSTWDFKPNDYFWVLSDAINVVKYANGQVVTSTENMTVTFGNVSGTYTATTTGEVSSSMTGTLSNKAKLYQSDAVMNWGGTLDAFSYTYDIPNEDEEEEPTHVTAEVSAGVPVNGKVTGTIDVEGTITGNAKGTGSGVFTGSIENVTQNVSARYVYSKEVTDAGRETGNYVWAKQAIIRGFATPATPTAFGLVKPSTGSKFGDVILDESSKQLRLTDNDINALNNVRWVDSDATVLQYASTDAVSMANLQGVRFINGVRIVLTGDGWDASNNVISRLRGDITIDVSRITNTDDSLPVLSIKDCHNITIKTGSKKFKVNVEDCTVATKNFNDIYRWVASRFDSGSNTAIVDNPWVCLDHAFSETYENSLLSRFVSVTRGEYGITSGELDIWIKRSDWTVPDSIEDLKMVSREVEVNFPPLYLRLDENLAVVEKITIPNTLNAKVSGTGGSHRAWDSTSNGYVPTGNFLSTVDWTHGGPVVFNARVLNPSGSNQHGLYDVRFRALVQFTDANDMNPVGIDYYTIN